MSFPVLVFYSNDTQWLHVGFLSAFHWVLRIIISVHLHHLDISRPFVIKQLKTQTRCNQVTVWTVFEHIFDFNRSRPKRKSHKNMLSMIYLTDPNNQNQRPKPAPDPQLSHLWAVSQSRSRQKMKVSFKWTSPRQSVELIKSFHRIPPDNILQQHTNPIV